MDGDSDGDPFVFLDGDPLALTLRAHTLNSCGVVCSRNNDRWPRRLVLCECVMPLIYAADGI